MLPDGLPDGRTDSQTYGRVTPKQYVYPFTANNKTFISPSIIVSKMHSNEVILYFL